MESCVRGYHIYQELWEAVIVCSPVKNFRAFNFRHLGKRRKIFNGENFTIYGTSLLVCFVSLTCRSNLCPSLHDSGGSEYFCPCD